MNPDWSLIARPGQFDLRVMTPARAKAEGLTLHPLGQLLGLISPNDARLPPATVSFPSHELLLSFIAAMKPCGISILHLPGEDVRELSVLLNRHNRYHHTLH